MMNVQSMGLFMGLCQCEYVLLHGVYVFWMVRLCWMCSFFGGCERWIFMCVYIWVVWSSRYLEVIIVYGFDLQFCVHWWFFGVWLCVVCCNG